MDPFVMISWMIHAADSLDPTTVGAAIRLARSSRGWSQEVLARLIAQTRRAGGESVDPASVKTQLSRWENDRVLPDRFTRQVLADVFSTTVEALFGLQPADDLPRPVLVESHVTAHTVKLLRARRAVHALTEASFGPAEASALVSHDLATIDGLLRVVPESPSRLHAAIARQRAAVAAVLGDRTTFERQVRRARDYATAPVSSGDLAPYADLAYVASEEANGLLVFDEPESAAATLAGHIDNWA